MLKIQKPDHRASRLGVNALELHALLQQHASDPEVLSALTTDPDSALTNGDRAALAHLDTGATHLPSLVAMAQGVVEVKYQQHPVEGRWHARHPWHFQSLPSVLRPAVTPTAADRTLIYADWRACHWQILAYHSGDTALIEDIEAGDFYARLTPPGMETGGSAVKRCASAFLNGGGIKVMQAITGNTDTGATIHTHVTGLFAQRYGRAVAWLAEQAAAEVASGRIPAADAYKAGGNALRRIEADMLAEVWDNLSRLGLSMCLAMHDGLLVETVGAIDVNGAAASLANVMRRVIRHGASDPSPNPHAHVKVDIHPVSWQGAAPVLVTDSLRAAAIAGTRPDANEPLVMLAAAIHPSALRDTLAALPPMQAPARAIRAALRRAASVRRRLSGPSGVDFMRGKDDKDGNPGKILDVAENVIRVVVADYDPSYDEMDHSVWSDGAKIDIEVHYTNFISHVADRYQWACSVGKNVILDCLAEVAKRRRFNSRRDEIDRLVWDGVPRLDDWLPRAVYRQYGLHPACPGPISDDILRLTSRYGRMLLVGAMARLYAGPEGEKMDTMLVLAGIQGVGKQRLWQALFRDGYSGTKRSDRLADAVLQSLGMWCIEDQEMSSYRGTDIESLKAWMSDQKDTVRLPYERAAVTIPRGYISVGSTNRPDLLLTDPTGNRRFWIVEVPTIEGVADNAQPEIDVEWVRENRDQILAEAREAYRAKEAHWIERKDDIYGIQQDHQENYMASSPLDDLARTLYDGAATGQGAGFSTMWFLERFDMNITKKDTLQGRSVHAAADALRRAGFIQARYRHPVGGLGRWWYKAKPAA